MQTIPGIRQHVFLTAIGAGQAKQGDAANCFQLPMMREEVENYLGLISECVCRILARFRKNGL
ncbi:MULTISPECIES: hypothetical protein [unclassified Duganella]|uniref:hypothetical protein n=1 Tax=unclassified Duganella TaxID=2636909 RepID=UPI0012E337F0